jgi:D-xylonolactonase
MPELKVIADYGDLCGESPVWDPDARSLYWIDNVGLRVYRYDWDLNKHQIVKQDIEINGCALNASGGFTVVNNSGIWLWDGRDTLRLIAAEADGSPCRMNDCIADPQGRLFSGSLFYEPSGKYPLGKLIRIDVDGSAQVVDEGFHISNGLAWSPGERELYFTDSGARCIYAYDYDRDSGNLRNRRVIVKVPAEEGLPDGLAVDAAGFLWSAQWYGSCVVRYDPSGAVERRIHVPAKQVSSIAFGGPDFTDIFITSAARSEPMPVMPPGYDPDSGYFGGRLFHTNLGLRGKPEFRTGFSSEMLTARGA